MGVTQRPATPALDLGPACNGPLSWLPGLGATEDEAQHCVAGDGALRSGARSGIEAPRGMLPVALRSGRGMVQNGTHERGRVGRAWGVFFRERVRMDGRGTDTHSGALAFLL
jgi:hypothetical protein